jgi:hypothetical protein
MTGMVAPTLERVRKSGDFDLPKKRKTFRLISPVETLWRSQRLEDGQLAAFKQFERDVFLTSQSIIARYSGAVGGGAGNSEEAQIARLDAQRNIAQLRCMIEPRCYRALVAAAENETPLQDIGRDILNIRNAPQARAAAEQAINQGTWVL